MNRKIHVVGWLLMWAFIFFAVFVAVPSNAKRRAAQADELRTLKAEAVERGHAEYVPDEHGNPTFRWRETNEAP